MTEQSQRTWVEAIRCHAREFARGLFRPSPASIFGAIFVAAALFGLCMWRITPAFVARHEGYFMRDALDNYVHLTGSTLRLVHSPPAEPACIVLGDSMIREAVSSEADLERIVGEKAGRPVSVHLLVADAMTQWEAVVVTDCIRGSVRGVVVLEMTPYNVALRGDDLHKRIRTPRLALDCQAEAIERKISKVERRPRLRNYFLDHYMFFAMRTEALRNLLTGPLSPPDHEVDERVPWTIAQWKREQQRITGWERHYDRFHLFNLALYQRMIDRLRQSGRISVVLLEGVLSPRMDELIDGDSRGSLRRRYRADVAGFARENSLEYWDIVRDMASEGKLSARDFQDYAHLQKKDARQRFTDELGTRLVDTLRRNRFLEAGRP